MSLRGPSGRSGFLKWINSVVGTSLEEMSQLSDGIAYMLLLDRYFPEKNVPLERLNLDATTNEQNVRNLNLLEKCFREYKVPKKVPIQNLARGKLQDHMRFIQWFYQFLTKRSGVNKNQTYDGVHKLTVLNDKKRVKKLIPQVEEDLKKVSESLLREFQPIQQLLEERNICFEKLSRIQELVKKYPNSKDSSFVGSIITEDLEF